ncbi:TIGR04283 family arsenosugar biosynthesis glycosyltransferase [Synechococcus sp. LA31]|nr:TIGR04283 family arsenosugar biosynthesis glycosyltransferase [Synechococcus sp. LA31]QVV68950.1 TIGR04283 family arsenosugar biosynthesis glycosyltransferase [Synechococcus sp. LA31]
MSRAELAVVIPALDEAGRLPLLLADLAQAPSDLIAELVVADGGSSDGTPQLARLGGAEVVHSLAGRGIQLARGISATTAPWLLLLHADARLCRDWSAVVRRAIKQPPAAWAFELAIEAPGINLRLLELAVRLRCRWRQLPYGDQGLLLPRLLLERAGGMPELPLMEDLLLIQRLQKLSRIRSLQRPLQVNGRRWQRHGVLGTAWRNAALRRAWRRGAATEVLARHYYGRDGANGAASPE